MLELLRIRNLALIDDLELEFAPGMNVLTGETGAGKSFIMRAVDFITGERMSPDMIRPGRDKALVEAVFLDKSDGELIIRRELSAETGRSRLYVNDSLSSQEAMKKLKSSLVLHTSQNRQQRLLSPAFQADVLDGFIKDRDPLRKRTEILGHLRDTADLREQALERCRVLSEKRDFLEYQRTEIERVSPRPGEEEELLARKQDQAGMRASAQAVEAALNRLHGEAGMLDQCGALVRDLEQAAQFLPEMQAFAEQSREHLDILRDLDLALKRSDAGADMDGELDRIESRLFELSGLKRKLGRSLEEILGLKAEIDENLSFLDESGLEFKRLEKDEARLAGELTGVLESLNAGREKAAAILSRGMEAELRQLGFSEHVAVSFVFEPQEIYPGIVENRARMHFIPNPGQPPRPLDQIASGGELSRFLLALTTLQSESGQAALIFDEVDTGIGGLTLNSVADKLAALAEKRQLIVITHWPQLAGRAGRHFKISKEVRDGQTYTLCERLQGDHVFNELSRMAGGGKQGQAVAGSLLDVL